MAERRKGSKKHVFSFPLDIDGRREFDETFIRNASVHIERMDECCFYIGIEAKGLPGLRLFTGIQGGNWFFNIEEDSRGGRFISVRRKAKFVTERKEAANG